MPCLQDKWTLCKQFLNMLVTALTQLALFPRLTKRLSSPPDQTTPGFAHLIINGNAILVQQDKVLG
jgi:hypothetical protein